MNSTKSIVVGSRGSRLARAQAESVINELKKAHPFLKIDLVTIKTTGDSHKQTSLDVLGGEGVFVKELEDALLQNRIDIAVHSAKDMPTIIPEGLQLTASTGRADPRDVLISRSGKLIGLPSGAVIGTGSQRRAVQLKERRSDLQIKGLRGNIDTRLEKVSSGELDGIVIAAAALMRLGWEDKITEYLDFVPAVGQGALGIETRSNDYRILEIIEPINDIPTYRSIIAERAFLRALGGGCRAPIAALAEAHNNDINLRGMVADPEGNAILHAKTDGNTSDPKTVGTELAQKMIEMGAAELIKGAN